jgi:hypothetical protein
MSATSSLVKRKRKCYLSQQKNRIIDFFKTLYDGEPKQYSQGSMMLFIPLMESSHYLAEYRSKIMFNHDKFNGDEAAVCIGGLKDLKTLIIKEWLYSITSDIAARFPCLTRHVLISIVSAYQTKCNQSSSNGNIPGNRPILYRQKENNSGIQN